MRRHALLLAIWPARGNCDDVLRRASREPACSVALTAILLTSCISTNIPTTDRDVTATQIAFATDGSLLIGGDGQRIDIVEENSLEPRGDFFIGRVADGTTLDDRWIGTPEPERLRGISATANAGMLAYGASLTAACDDSAWHQRGALIDVGPTGGVLRAVTLSRTTMVPIGDCEFPEAFHLSWAAKAANRTVFAGDWLAYDEGATAEGLTIGSFASDLQWTVRFDGEATLGAAALEGDATYVAVTENGTSLTRFDGDGNAPWTVAMDWEVTAMRAQTTGIVIAGFCASEEVCVARLDADGQVVASRRIAQLEAETVEFASDNTIVAWDGTKLFSMQFDEMFELQEASFVEAGAAPASVRGDEVAWIVDGGLAAWRAGEACERPSFVIEELAVEDANLALTSIDSPWVDEELRLETWTVVPEPRGEPIDVDDCR